MTSTKNLIIIAGPTAIGKTNLAIKIALHFQTEVISADSRQFYKEMEIGTAKPSKAELAQVKHHFIDSHSINQPFSVGDYEEQAIGLIDKLFEKYDDLILVGGSGLFIKAVTDGFDNLPKASPEIREQLNKVYHTEGISLLQKQLSELDPAYFNEVDINNPQRVIRALEVCISTGQPFSSFRNRTLKQRNFNSIKIGLNIDREKLYKQINFRVDQMAEHGLVEEVRQLLPFRHLNALNTVGYSELFEYFDGVLSLDEAIESIKQNTRRFAKRQLTWFRKDHEIQWFEPNQYEEILEFVESIRHS